jgi:hypothetical protein
MCKEEVEREETCNDCGKIYTGHEAAVVFNQYNTDHVCYQCNTKRTRAITRHQEGKHAIKAKVV